MAIKKEESLHFSQPKNLWGQPQWTHISIYVQHNSTKTNVLWYRSLRSFFYGLDLFCFLITLCKHLYGSGLKSCSKWKNRLPMQRDHMIWSVYRVYADRLFGQYGSCSLCNLYGLCNLCVLRSPCKLCGVRRLCGVSDEWGLYRLYESYDRSMQIVQTAWLA